jgi:DNA-binding protein
VKYIISNVKTRREVMNKNIGELIKQKRTENKMTLKDISEATDLSIGFLSQLERGLTSIAQDTLKKVAKALNVEMSYFMDQPKSKEKVVLRSYEKEILRIEGGSIIEYLMTNMVTQAEMLPKLVEILPQKEVEESLTYSHEGEEFVYVLEGILTLKVENEVYDLYPGDCAHYLSTRAHNWSNQTNKVVKFITINTPNLFKETGETI